MKNFRNKKKLRRSKTTITITFWKYNFKKKYPSSKGVAGGPSNTPIKVSFLKLKI